MKKYNRAIREILHRVQEKNEIFMSQKSLAQACKISMDTVNRMVTKLSEFRAIEKKPFGFRVIEPKKVLLFWAATRNLTADIVYSTYSPDSMEEIESDMPKGTIFTAFSGFHKRFGKAPTAHDEVYVYSDREEEIKRRFPERMVERSNIFVLKSDPHLAKLSKDGVATIAQIYVDLWQVGGSQADRHLLELDQKLEAKPVEALKALAKLEPSYGS
ncbi:MAG: replication/maintenance protein RepL [Candidatus Zixiibacteriota bacterium]